MNRQEKQDEIFEMFRGVPPQNILISFNDEPPKTLAEHMNKCKRKTPQKDNKERER